MIESLRMEHFYSFATFCILFIVTLLWLQRKFYNKESRKHGSLLDAIVSKREEYDSLNSKVVKSHQELESNQDRLRELLEKEKQSNKLEAELERNTKRNAEISDEIQTKIIEKAEADRELTELKIDIDHYNRIYDLIDYGIYEDPNYLYETSERYKIEIKAIRDKQKDLIKEKKAFEYPKEIEISGSSKNGKSVIDGQLRIMMRAFNIECDYLIQKVNPSNVESTLERIDKVAEGLEKSTLSLMCGISSEYMKLKYKECTLHFQFKLRKEEEITEQKLIKEQMREEAKARREYERAITAAEKEERMYSQLLEKAKTELSNAQAEEQTELQNKIELLESQLQEALEKESRAKSLAEQTRKGHVYIISNIGSFGENVYKIGLTRRLDPMDRVKELGDASVPFTFDVHAIIYADDAPKMESELHKKFNHCRVNAINKRKEFFNTTLTEIKNQVRKISGNEHDFRMTALAEQYYETLRLQGRSEDVA